MKIILPRNLPCFSKIWPICHHAFWQLYLWLVKILWPIQRLSKDEGNFISMKNPHPIAPRIGARSLEKLKWLWSESDQWLKTYMIKVVIIDFISMLCILHCKIIARTNEEEISNNIANHFLVQVSIIHMLPVCVLKSKLINQ